MKKTLINFISKTFSIIFCFLFMTSHLNAQIAIENLPVTEEKTPTITEEFDKKEHNKTRFQIRGGLTVSNLTASWGNENSNATPLAGFNIRGIADLPFAENWYVQTGLGFVSKGAKVDEIDVNGSKADATMRAQYLQVPLYFTYKMNLSKEDNKLALAFGPYLAYGIAGSTNFERGGSNIMSINTFDDNLGLWNRTDAGLGFEFQYETRTVVFIISSELGLTKAWKSSALTDSSVYVRNIASLFTIGFKL